MRIRIALALLVLSAGSAHALEQAAHRSISSGMCRAYGLPEDFCDQVGVETYNVDSSEWNDMAAHSQIDAGQTECQAANLALNRVRWLGGQMRETMWGLSYSSSEEGANLLAQQLGRALHTVQDNCAHSGMPNPQHAWWSLSDTCHGTKYSPDLVPAATTCAVNETRAVFQAFVGALSETGVERSALGDIDGSWSHWPGRGDICSFLRGADTWDGVDRRWNNGKMVPALRSQLVLSLSGSEAWNPVCQGGVDDIRVSNAPFYTGTAAGQQRCFKISAFCIGKADDGTTPPDAPPPWSEEDPSAAAAPQAGCSVAGGRAASPAVPVLALLGLALIGRRSRSRKK